MSSLELKGFFSCKEINPESYPTGKELSFFSRLSFQINDNFNLTPSITYSRLKKISISENYFKGYIARLSGRYQFTKSISFRLISEYNDFQKKLLIQPLFQWNPNAFTIFYIGGNQNALREEINDEFLSDSEKEKEKERSDSEKGTSDSEEETTYSEEIDQALVDELIKKRIAKKEEEVLQTFKEIRYSWEVFWSAGPEKPICDCDSCNLHKYPYQCRSFVPPRPWVN